MRTEEPICLVLVDIDHFKLFNDIAGHLVGDECLKAVANALTIVIQRPTDLVARFGGEEFAIILPATSLAGAAIIARRAVKAVAALRLHHSDSRVQQITISAGVAIYHPNPQEVAVDPMLPLIAATDAALYQAKKDGRNRVKESLL